MMLVVAYDISTVDPEGAKRLRKVRRICADYGTPVQGSVFECEVDAEQYRYLQKRLTAAICEKTDRLRFYLLGNHWENRIVEVGKYDKNCRSKYFVL